MGGAIHIFVTLPTLIYTVLLGATLLYWLSVVLGALDLDALGGDGADHGGDAHHHDAGDASGDGDGDGDADHAGHGDLLSALGGMSIRKVPLTISLSFTVIFGWLLSALAVLFVGDLARRAGVPSAAFNAVTFTLTLLVALRLAGLAVRPIAKVFEARGATKKEQLTGRLAEVSTARLDARFGQVLVADGGAGLLIDARWEGDRTLRRGERVVITHLDAESAVAHVELLDASPRVRATDEGERAEAELSHSAEKQPNRRGSDSG